MKLKNALLLGLLLIPTLALAQALPTGKIHWQTMTTVTLTGSSQTCLAAREGRAAVMIYNKQANDSVTIDVAGGALTTGVGYEIIAGNPFIVVGAVTPTFTAITCIGTASQVLYIWEGL